MSINEAVATTAQLYNQTKKEKLQEGEVLYLSLSWESIPWLLPVKSPIWRNENKNDILLNIEFWQNLAINNNLDIDVHTKEGCDVVYISEQLKQIADQMNWDFS